MEFDLPALGPEDNEVTGAATAPVFKATFQEYPSICLAKSSGKKLRGLSKEEEWVATEKIHGSNFSFMVNSEEVLCCRRTAVLEDSETFYGWQLVRDQLAGPTRKLFETVARHPTYGEELAAIKLFGELYGGIYPHADVPDEGHQPVQRGVYYSPTIRFMAFDLQVVMLPPRPSVWMDCDTFAELLELCGIPHLRPLKRGSIEECLATDITFDSTVPAALGLPPLPRNQVEGIVVKPAGMAEYGKRSVFKKKNPKFDEVNPPAPLSKYEQEANDRMSAGERIYQELPRYLNANRLDSVQSKHGVLTIERLAEGVEWLSQDALKDFKGDMQDTWDLVSEVTQERVEKNFRSMTRTWLVEQLGASQ
eukprot:TRINITY_DN31773_c0_g1_i1.p1 TRINITY_DN31773_c0_g1~~TRINITY_DN31773_c0_g1_i1.p1  ORF type:complete len:364 (-),score=47.68 TRINITY_DN31773_c0_g1_i1:61-1152(-)